MSTQSSVGVGNLAPYSYFNVMAHSPPHVAIGFCASRLRSHGRKDSLVNILDTGWVDGRATEWQGAPGGAGCMFVGANACAVSGRTDTRFTGCIVSSHRPPVRPSQPALDPRAAPCLPCLPAHCLNSEFVVNIMSEWFVEAANHCCGNFDYGENEMELSGLTPLPSLKVCQ